MKQAIESNQPAHDEDSSVKTAGKLVLKEKLSYGLGDFSSNLIWGFML